MKFILFSLIISFSLNSKEIRRDRIPAELDKVLNCLSPTDYQNTPFNDLFNSLSQKQFFFLVKSEFYKHIFNSAFLPFTYQRDFKFNFVQNKKFLIQASDQVSKLCDIENFMYELIVKNRKYSISKKYLYTWSNFLKLKMTTDEDIPKPNYLKLFQNITSKLKIIKQITLKPKLRTNYVFLHEKKFETSRKNTIQTEETNVSNELDKIFESLDK